ncbi:hypothetical protein [Caulobacter phage Cr30]|uniref:hypothetical protein n=1 Tax=Caulobacter phage Cr30 TaxID=1357714 RepID=UPI0004A9B98A|nr:hypothetical protein OZ74_gp175 [Caulobacter phage Cr30]AGS81168.1 hypothetical protein [Caulobacter phage Cr30]
MVRSVTEILSEVNSKKNKEERIAVLQAYANKHWSIKHILRMTFDPNANFRVAQGDQEVNYKPCTIPDQYNMLHSEARRLYLFLDGSQGNPNLSQTKADLLFIQLLEGLDKDDAETLLYIVKNKKLPFKNVTKELVEAALPGLI